MKKGTIGLLVFILIVGVSMASCSLEKKEITKSELVDSSNYIAQGYELATFAGGCFWCVEAGFQELPGVVSAISGYTGGTSENPTYQSHGSHVEAVQIYFDPKVVSYRELVDELWLLMDPTDDGGQFGDRGSSYLSAVFVHDETQREIATASKQMLIDSNFYDAPIVTPILDATAFYVAEEYHQDYYKKSAIHYKLYEKGSGRADFKKDAKEKADEVGFGEVVEEEEEEELYVKPSEEELKELLTTEQFIITQKGGTEKPFENAYWDNKDEGIYVDSVTGQPLFSSTDKYDSGTGWPSFTKPISDDVVQFKSDTKLSVPRTEVTSTSGDTHLGHVFTDGPVDDGGLRYCLNSASLRFVAKENLSDEGFAEFIELFE